MQSTIPRRLRRLFAVQSAARLFVSLLLAFGIFTSVNAGSVDVDQAAPSAILVQVHADWCGSCKVLDPRISAMSAVLRENNVLVVKLDFTNAATSASASMLASALGINDVVAANNGTGKLLVFRGDERATATVLTRANSNAEILAAVGAS